MFITLRRKLGELLGWHSVRLCVEPQQGGYAFVHSPDLPGFTFVLGPGEDKDNKTVMDAIFVPLNAFLKAKSEPRTPPPGLSQSK